MRAVQDAVANRVGQRRISDVLMPVLRRELTGDDRRPGVVPVVENLEHIAALLIAEGRQAPVIEDEDVDARQLGEQPDVGAVGMRESERVKEPGEPPVAGPVAVPAGLVGQRAGEETRKGGSDRCAAHETLKKIPRFTCSGELSAPAAGSTRPRARICSTTRRGSALLTTRKSAMR